MAINSTLLCLYFRHRSLFTFQQPQQPVYAAVMCFASVLFVCMTYILHDALGPIIAGDKETSSQLSSNFKIGILAFMGLATHAIIPLQNDILLIASGRSGTPMQYQSIIHQVLTLCRVKWY